MQDAFQRDREIADMPVATRTSTVGVYEIGGVEFIRVSGCPVPMPGEFEAKVLSIYNRGWVVERFAPVLSVPLATEAYGGMYIVNGVAHRTGKGSMDNRIPARLYRGGKLKVLRLLTS